MNDVFPSRKVVDVNFNMYTKICLPDKLKEADPVLYSPGLTYKNISWKKK